MHSNDSDLLEALNEYSGYLVARGYNVISVKYHLANMANSSTPMVLRGEYKPPQKLVVPLISSVHPAASVLSQIVNSSLSTVTTLDPVLEVLLPPTLNYPTYSSFSAHMTRTRWLQAGHLFQSMVSSTLVVTVKCVKLLPSQSVCLHLLCLTIPSNYLRQHTADLVLTLFTIFLVILV
jgi:hypothetical protein